MIPFRGRLNFRQYIPGKRYKYDVKFFKLCDPVGHMYSLRIYAGKNTPERENTEDLVMRLMAPYLNKGQLLVTDNFYTSVPLAERLLRKRTYLLGTVRANQKNIPKIGIKCFPCGGFVAYENPNKVIFMDERSKRLV